MIGTCMPKLLEPHENQCDSMIFCLLFFLHLAPVRSTFDFIIALILFSFFSFRKSIAILPVFLSRYFLCFYCCCCCCFYSVRKIIGSDFQTLFNGTDNLYVHLFVCFALRVHVSGFSILPIISCFWFFILLFIIRCRCCCCCCWPLSLLSFFLCYWNAHAYQSLRRLLSSSTRRLLWLLAAVAVAVVCLVFQHLKSNSYTNKHSQKKNV